MPARRDPSAPRVAGAVLTVLALAAACARPAPDAAGPLGSASPTASASATPGSASRVPPGRDPAQRYEVVATVLEGPLGAVLCAGAVADSLPPQCGGPRLAGFSWATVEGEHTARDVTWADEIRLVGTYDGETFHLTEPAANGTRPPGEDVDFTTPCPAPAGGWRVVDPARAGEVDEVRASEYAARQPEYAGSWLDWLADSPPQEQRPHTEAVANYTFTKNLATHEAALRRLWGGPLCVSRGPRTVRELERVQDRLAELHKEAGAAGVEILGSSRGELEGRVQVSVLIDDAVTRKWLADRFGDLVAVSRGAFRPL